MKAFDGNGELTLEAYRQIDTIAAALRNVGERAYDYLLEQIFNGALDDGDLKYSAIPEAHLIESLAIACLRQRAAVSFEAGLECALGASCNPGQLLDDLEAADIVDREDWPEFQAA